MHSFVFPSLRAVAHDILVIAVLFLAPTHIARAAPESVTEQFVVPDGFAVELYAGDDLAHDIHTLTVDSRGRVVVAGKGYVHILHDDDADGRADRATRFASRPRDGARGLHFDGSDLICSGDRALWRFRDADSDDVADGEPEVIVRNLGRGGDHAANGMIRGPDGWLYWIWGNDAGAATLHARAPGSPVRDPSCGVVLRVSPDGEQTDIYAHGFRNPYDIAFGPLGGVFTYDADGERDEHLPWYSPTRVFDIAQGMHHGWVLRKWVHAWNRPPYIPDSVERLVEIGRGSPTGVVCYRHVGFPERFRGGLLAACWSLGRIYFLPLKPRGATYESNLEIFLQARGALGFAPVDLAVGGEGEVFVAIGGRGTRGSVFRVRYTGADSSTASTSKSLTPLLRVLRARQPLSSWSRAQWRPLARQLGRDAFRLATENTKLARAERIRAIEILVEVFGGVNASWTARLTNDADPLVAARAVWALSRSAPSRSAARTLVQLTGRREPRLARRVWEALAAWPSRLPNEAGDVDWKSGFRHSSRRVRAAAVLAAGGPASESFERSFPPLPEIVDTRDLLGVLQARVDAHAEGRRELLMAAARAFRSTDDEVQRIEALRVMQRALGDIRLVQDQASVEDGFRARAAQDISSSLRRKLAKLLARGFPTDHRWLDREIARTVALLEVDATGFLDSLAAAWSRDSDVEDDIHFLLAAAHIGGKRSESFSQSCARALARLHDKMERDDREPSRFWPVRVREAFERLCALDAKLSHQLTRSQHFRRADQSLLVQSLTGEVRLEATRRLVVSTLERKGPWSSNLLELAAELPADTALGAARAAWDQFELRDAAAIVLARHARSADRLRLFEAATTSRQSNVVAASAQALARLPPERDLDALLDIVETLRSFSSREDHARARSALSDLLAHWTGEPSPELQEKASLPRALFRHWVSWLSDAHPEEAELVNESDGEDIAALLKRLPQIEWSSGDAQRGKASFQKRACQTCHVGSRRLGPSLDGVATRFSREDLFIAIADPSRDISPAHESKEIRTRSGIVYHGTMIYSSPAATLIQTGADSTVRVRGSDIVSVRPSPVSFMPEGLLAGATDRELADLYAYIETLQAASN